jgi:hypothetical protein
MSCFHPTLREAPAAAAAAAAAASTAAAPAANTFSKFRVNFQKMTFS